MALHPLLLWLLLLLPPLLLLLNKINSLHKRHKNLPPGPPKLPIIGNLHQLGALPHHSLRRLSARYGPVMLIHLCRTPTLIISSVEAAKEVLKHHDLECCSRPLLTGPGRLSYNYLDIAFVPFGDYWREVRKLCVLELFSNKRVQSFRPVREEEVALLVDSISESAAAGSAVDLGEKSLTLLANITCRVAFGKSFTGSGIDNGRFEEVIHEALAMLGSFSASDFFPTVGWVVDRITGLHRRMERSFKDLDGFYEQVIEEHLDRGRIEQDQEDIIDVLLRIERDQAVSGALRITKDHIKAILMNIFLAGVDTGALTIVWAMAELARDPRAMKKAQAEVRSYFANKGRVAESELDQLPFLKMVVKETLRLHPANPILIPRETMSQFKLNGYNVYPKTRVHVNVWAIGRDPSLWENPEEFFPERFANSSIDFKGQHYELLPFGAGRRGCPGIYMGATMVELALANLLYHFDWKLPSGMKEEDLNMDEKAGLTVYKRSPLLLVPVKHVIS
ncbi:cytochrome P450 71B10-like [Malania oleifera]|uniref:cytochrome P450 71B10-like n=1 Tax=Malania oleifera TaxID=397392 RepID=UPI0025ADAE47|nr:cytochrome P450 71B10-like [Malania oleifera]